jgi:hypothetical protein
VTKFKVTIKPDVPPGNYDVRFVNKWGVSNPRSFLVGDLAEVTEKEPNDDVPQAQRVAINTTINGAIASPTDVDYFVFAGKKDQKVIISCLTSSIDSRLIAGIQLYDAAGRLLAANRHYRDSDALLDCTLPGEGDYHVRVFEFTHAAGSLEHFYRLTISTAPWIDAILPLSVQPGKPAALTVFGRNLPGSMIDPGALVNERLLERTDVAASVPADALDKISCHAHVNPQSGSLDGFEYRLRNASGVSNPFLLTYARAPVATGNGSNDAAERAQEIRLPCEVSGCIRKLHERAWYSFSAKKGETYNIEVVSDRLGAQTDMYFLLRNADKKEKLADMDDNPDVLSPVRFYTRSNDPPVYKFTAPADGRYQLMLSSRDADTRAGMKEYYLLRITAEQPDFHLIVMPPDMRRPDGCCLRQGGQENYSVFVWRHDGWNGPVTLTAEGLPSGVTAPAQIAGPNVKQAEVVLSAAANAPPWTGEIKIRGTAVINGKTVVHEARPASITWPVPQPQGVPAISRLDRSLVLAVREKPAFTVAATAEKLVVLQETKLKLDFKLGRLWPDLKGPVQITPIDRRDDFPRGLVFNGNNPITIAADKNEGTAVLDVQRSVPPGTYNVVLRGTAQVPFNKDPKAKEKPNINVIQPTTPIGLTVLPKEVAEISVENGNPTLKAGSQMDLVVRVTRKNDYTGPFLVQLILPPNTQGLMASEVAIPSGKNDAKLMLRSPAGSAPGTRANLIVRAVATLQGTFVITHETKINVNIVK